MGLPGRATPTDLNDRALPHVLVVGDEVRASESLADALAECAACTPVVGAGQATAALRRREFDAALVAVRGESPEEALVLARRLLDETDDLALVLLADSRSLDDLVQALRLGVVDYLSRPLSDGELVDAVVRAVEWRATIRATRQSSEQRQRDRVDRVQQLVDILAAFRITSSLALDRCLETLYARDDQALRHLRRVASGTMLMAKAMKIGEPLLGDIWRAALLHDIGKLSIPPQIVGKAGPLSSDEQDVMRSHVQVAATALRHVPFLASAAETVGASREHFDGTGPSGLRGSVIPIGARILAVAEAFDTLSWEVASPADPSTAAANAELVRGSGKRFDPAVVNAWLEAVDVAEREARDGAVDWRVRCS